MSTTSHTPLAGKVALITGGSKGIGRATAILLAQQGAQVAINYASDSGAADDTIKALGGRERGLAIQADAGSMAGIETMVKATVDAFGRIDILIPNAGVLPMKDVASTTEADFDATFGVNVKGPYFLVQKSIPHMPAGAHVILLSTSLCSMSGVQPPYTLYVTSKGAIEQMTRMMARDLGKSRGILVNAVAPGPTATELFLRGKSEQLLNTIKAGNPFNRLGTPEEIADTMAHLAVSTWMSGQVVMVNGGFCP